MFSLQIQSTYLNPTNAPLDADGYFSDDAILNRVPSLFLLLGSIYGIVQVIMLILILTNQKRINYPLPLRPWLCC